MIVSHAHRAIFVKTRKTAGTSIELALSAVCGDADVITPLEPRDEQLRTAAGTRGPQHFRPSVIGRRAMPWRRSTRAWNHMPASDVVRLVGRKTWDEYFTFAVERNPWDRAVSLYYFRGRNDDQLPPFSAFLRLVPADRLSNFELYTIDGQPAVERLLRYERLQEELAEVWGKLGVQPPELAHAKAGFRPGPSKDFRTLYSDDDAQFVADVCRREIAALGYRFDP